MFTFLAVLALAGAVYFIRRDFVRRTTLLEDELSFLRDEVDFLDRALIALEAEVHEYHATNINVPWEEEG